MSAGYTYQKPNDEAFLDTLVKYLEFNGENKIADLLKGAKCAITPSTTFSRKRWDAYWTEIRFYLPINELRLVTEEIKEVKQKLVDFCNKIMPIEAGLDVMEVEFSPLISTGQTPKTLTQDLEETIQTVSQEVLSQVLPDDIKRKGREMAEVYLYLYCVENSLRLFIDKVAKDKFGDKYFSKLQLNKGIRDSVAVRKSEESKNKWLRLRGDTEIFYLDFKDLSAIIQNNWTLFSSYFPDLNWITTKIDELANCRNLVAHNSLIGEHEKDVIRVNYTSILKQLNVTLKD